MYSPFTIGGEQRVVTTIANYLVENKYDVSFFLTDKQKRINYDLYSLNKKVNLIFFNDYFQEKNILQKKYYSLLKKINYKTGIFSKNKKILKKLYCTKKEKATFIKIINEFEFDYMIGIGSDYYGILSILKKELNNTKIIAWEHSCYNAYFETKGRRFNKQDSFVEFMLENIDTYVVQTVDDQKKLFHKYKFNATVIENPNTYTNCKKSDLNNKNFIAAGRFDFVKNFESLIYSFYLFSQKNNDWNLYIYGDGEKRNKCKKLIKKLGLNDRVFLPGSTTDMSSKYLNASIYLMTSKWEGWGMVVTEAMQHGLPIISYNIPCIKEILANSNAGIIVNDFNEIDYANQMLNMVSKMDLKKMSENSIKKVSEYDIKNIGKKWMDLLMNIK